MNRPLVLDTSFLIDLERETRDGRGGPAVALLRSQPGRRFVVSVVSVAELLEGSADETATLTLLAGFPIQGIQFTQARRCALLQRRSSRRMGENDAWLVATADTIDADVVGADRPAFERLGSRYLRFRP